MAAAQPDRPDEPIEVVKLAPDAWPAYRALRLRALAEEPQAFGGTYADAAARPDATWRDWLADAATGRGRWLLFARRGVQLVGLIGAFSVDPPAEPARAAGTTRGAGGTSPEYAQAGIFSVFVPAEERGKGIGAQLMASMIETLRATGRFDRISLTVNAAQAAAVGLYRRFGFEVVREADAVLGDGKTHREYVMERSVP